MVDDGTVPKALVKDANAAVDLLKEADDKLKKVLEMYVPARKSTGSNRSKTSSKRSKSSALVKKSVYESVPKIEISKPIGDNGKVGSSIQ